MNNNKNNNVSFINYWLILCVLIPVIMSVQVNLVYAWCDSDDHEMIILSQTDGISFHSAYYKVSRESGWIAWNGVDGGTVNKGEELSTNKVDFVQWPWDNCYDYDWKLSVKYNNLHTLTEEFTDLEGDHKYAVTVLVGQGGNMKFLPVATASGKSDAIEQAMENAANYYKWVGDGESETDWLDRDNATGEYDWIFIQSVDSDDETLSEFFAEGELSGTIYWDNGTNRSWNQSIYENIRPSGIEVRRKHDGLAIEDFITQYDGGDEIGPQYYDVIDGFKSKTVNNSTLLSTGRYENDGMTVQEFFDFEVKYYYEWTNWLDLDDDGGSNNGDIEYLHELYNDGRVGCQTPTAIQCRPKDSSNVLDGTNAGVWSELEHDGYTVYCDAELGFACIDALNPNGCGDWEVRFYCSENESVDDDRPTLSLQDPLPETNYVFKMLFDGNTDIYSQATVSMTTSSDSYDSDRNDEAESAYVFDGTNTMKAEWNQSFGQEVTLSLWFKGDSNGSMTNYPRLVEFSSDGTYKGTTIAYDTDGTLRAWCQDSSGDRKGSINHSVSYKDDLWHHVAYVNNQSESILYVDGIPVGTSNNPCSNIDDPEYLSIGSPYYSDTIDIFAGSIDDVQIFDSALTTSEIVELAEIDTVAKFDFSSTANGVSTTDKISMTNDSATLTSDRYGNSNSAYSFNGNDSMKGAWSQNFTNEMTMSVRFKADSSETDGGRLVEFFSGENTWIGTTIAYESDGQIMTWCQEQGPWSQNRSGAMYNKGSGLNDGLWHHAAVTHSTAGMKLYIDGYLTASTSGYCSNIADAAYISIGSPLSTNYSNKMFKGDVDDVKIYDRELSPDEIKQFVNIVTFYQHDNYNGSKSGYSVDLVAGEYNLSDLQSYNISNDSLSALKINQPNYQVVLYKDSNFSGSSVTLDSDIPQLSTYGVNDWTSSLIIELKAVTFYGDANYGINGDFGSVTLGPGEYSLTELQLRGITNDDIHSFKNHVSDTYKVRLCTGGLDDTTNNTCVDYEDKEISSVYIGGVSSLRISAK